MQLNYSNFRAFDLVKRTTFHRYNKSENNIFKVVKYICLKKICFYIQSKYVFGQNSSQVH